MIDVLTYFLIDIIWEGFIGSIVSAIIATVLLAFNPKVSWKEHYMNCTQAFNQPHKSLLGVLLLIFGIGIIVVTLWCIGTLLDY